jgi:hypothetical protein
VRRSISPVRDMGCWVICALRLLAAPGAADCKVISQ